MNSRARRRSFSIFLFVGLGLGLTLILGNRSPLTTPQDAPASPAPAAVQAVSYDWLQMNGDPQHSGNNTRETILGASNVAGLELLFRVLLPFPADGTPVGLTSVVTPSGTRDLLFTNTKNGILVASDAATGDLIWSKPHPATYGPTNQNCNASPAIDPNRLYVYSYGLDGYAHKHQVGDGAEITGGGWPALTTLKSHLEKATGAFTIATVGSGATYLYVAHGGYKDDVGDYQGHVTTINLADGTQNVFNTLCSDQTVHFVTLGSPDCDVRRSAIWAKDGVIYDNVTDRIYFATGNGPFDAHTGGHNWGDSLLSLHTDGTGIGGGNPVDSWTPTDFDELERVDRDLGSTGPALLPSSPLAPAGYAGRLAVQGGKDRQLKLIDLNNMSGQGGPGHVGGEIERQLIPQGGGLLSVPAVWINPADGTTWVFIMNNSGSSGFRLEFPGGVPSLVKQWQQANAGHSPLVANNVVYFNTGNIIRAVDPLTGLVLWSDAAHSDGNHWQSPVVINGRLYLQGDGGHLTAWALPPGVTPTANPTTTPTAGALTQTPTRTLTKTPAGTGTQTRTATKAPATKTPTRTNTPTTTVTKTPTSLLPTRTPTGAPTGTAVPTPTPTPGNVVIPSYADFRDVRRGSDINAGPDTGATGHDAINLTGLAGALGDAWITVYDAVPATPAADSVFGTVSLTADVLIQSYNNKKGVGLLALFNESSGQEGLSLVLINSGGSDSLVLGTVSPATGVFTTLKTVSLTGNILEGAWYRLTMDVSLSGAKFRTTARVFRHAVATDPNSPTGVQVGGTLSLVGALPAVLAETGEVGIVASAVSTPVTSSVTNFRIYP